VAAGQNITGAITAEIIFVSCMSSFVKGCYMIECCAKSTEAFTALGGGGTPSYQVVANSGRSVKFDFLLP